MSSSPSPKSRHYWAQLRGALTAGAWLSPAPARAPNGVPLSWAELLRKFNKHCRGFADVAAVAEHTHALAVLLLANTENEDDDHTGNLLVLPVDVGDECVLPEERREEARARYEALLAMQAANYDTIHLTLAYYAYALSDPAACLSHLQRVPELLQPTAPGPASASSAPSTTGSLLTVPFSSVHPSAQPSLSSLSPSASFASLLDSAVAEIKDGRGWALTESFRSICLQGMALERLHPTTPQNALAAYATATPLFSLLAAEFSSLSAGASGTSTIFPQLRELWRWVERLLWRAIVLSSRVCDVRPSPSSSSSSPFSSDGNDNDNAPAQADHDSSQKTNLWTWFAFYTSTSVSWPASFRTAHRSTISSLYLRALVLRHSHHPHSAPCQTQTPNQHLLFPPSPSTLAPSLSPSHTTASTVTSPSTSPTTTPTPPAHSHQRWLQTARSLAQDYRALLAYATRFPAAGAQNTQVEEFADLCVAVWEAAGCQGEGAGWVVDILWWATRLTFNSSRILRHMTRLLHLSGDTPLAIRTLRLYVQVVGKAWQAAGGDTKTESKLQDDGAETTSTEGMDDIAAIASESRPGVATAMSDDNMAEEDMARAKQASTEAQIRSSFSSSRASPASPVVITEDTDTSVYWVSTLVFGARMLCVHAQGVPGAEGVALLREARELLEKARTRLDEGKQRRLLAEVLLAEGVCLGLLGIKEEDPHTRPTLLSHSHARLVASLSTHPLPQAHYHLALALARPGPMRDLPRAIQHAGHAVEGAPGDVRAWHLLGLLLGAEERWAEAKEVLELGAGVGAKEDVDGEEEEEGEEESAKVSVIGPNREVKGVDFAFDGNGNANTNMDMNIKTPNPTAPNPSTVSIPPSSSSPPSTITPSAKPKPLYVLPPTSSTLPPAGSLLRPILAPTPPSKEDLFEYSLQLRMTLAALTEVVEGAEGAELKWVEVFAWVAENKHHPAEPAGRGASMDEGPRPFGDGGSVNQAPGQGQEKAPSVAGTGGSHLRAMPMTTNANGNGAGLPKVVEPSSPSESLQPPIPITISPATPEVEAPQGKKELRSSEDAQEKTWESPPREKEKERGGGKEKEKRAESPVREKKFNGLRVKRSLSIDRIGGGGGGGEGGKPKKKVGQMLKHGVHKGSARITAVSRKIGNGVVVVKNGSLRRSNSSPDLTTVLRQSTYQASSIHSRRRLSSVIHSQDRTPTDSPPPPPPPAVPPAQEVKHNSRLARENRLLSDLWLMSAATFRRLGKIEQAKGAIQEAEVRDENNPAVWAQLGLYYVALRHFQHAIDAFQKALFINPDDVSATVHLSRLYLEGQGKGDSTGRGEPPSSSDVDLAAGLLSNLTKGRGCDVPEAWYFLAKAYGLQGRRERERKTLVHALELSEHRGLRDIGGALGWCI